MAKHKVGGGASFFFIVLTIGLIMALLNLTLGAGFTVKIPATEVNLSFGGSIGEKEVTRDALPGYISNRIADNNTFINHTTTVTIWIAEGTGVFVLGNQPEAPAIDLSVNLR